MSACLTCRQPLSSPDENAYQRLLVIEETTAEVTGVVCPLCSFLDREPCHCTKCVPPPLEDHVHLFLDGSLN